MSMIQKILDISREPFRGEEPLYQLVLIAESCTQSERFGSIQMRLGDYVKILASYASEPQFGKRREEKIHGYGVKMLRALCKERYSYADFPLTEFILFWDTRAGRQLLGASPHKKELFDHACRELEWYLDGPRSEASKEAMLKTLGEDAERKLLSGFSPNNMSDAGIDLALEAGRQLREEPPSVLRRFLVVIHNHGQEELAARWEAELMKEC